MWRGDCVISVQTGIHENVILVEARIVANINNPYDFDFHPNDRSLRSLFRENDSFLQYSKADL